MSSSASSIKSDLSELRSSISEMKNLSSSTLGRLRGSAEDVTGSDSEPLVTFPESPPPEPPGLKFEQKRLLQASKSKMIGEGFTRERASADRAELRKMSIGDTSYQETQAQKQRMERLERDGVKAEKSLNMVQEQRTLKSGDIAQHETQNRSEINVTVETEKITTQKNTMANRQHTYTSTGSVETLRQQSQQQNFYISGTSQAMNKFHMVNGQNLMMLEGERNASIQNISFDDLEKLNASSTPAN